MPNIEMARVFDFLIAPVRKYPRMLFWGSFLVWLPGIFTNDAFFMARRCISLSSNLLLSFFIFYLICFFIFFVSRINDKFEKVLLAIFHIIVYGMFLWEVTLFILFDCKTNANVFQLIDETNFQETSEFIKGYLLSLKFAFVCLLMVCFILIENFSLKIYLHIEKKCLPKQKKIFEFLLLFFIFLGCSSFLYHQSFFTLDFREDWKKVESKRIRYFPLFYIYQAVSQFVQERNLFDACALSNEDLVVDDVDPVSKTIVVIVGESFNRHHSSLYGYTLRTNPKLELLNDLFVFKDVIAPMNATSDVFRDFLSMASIDDSKEWYQTPMFPAIFKKAGFNVVFYSNQFVVESNMTTYDASCGFFNHPSLAPKLFSYRNSKKYEFDENLIEEYKQKRSTIESDSLNLIMFHLLGQHVLYESRFPQNRMFFSEKDYSHRNELNERQKREVANYDNATLYNDSIVFEIIKMYENQNAMVVYFADHGDEVNDYRLHVGRSRGLHLIGAPGLHCQLDIPFLIWMSEKWKKNNPGDEDRIKKHIESKFVIDDIPHLLLDFAKIKTPYFNPRRSLINDNFYENRKRIVRPLASSPVDYDLICEKYGVWKIGF